jgi:hypothetical protein
MLFAALWLAGPARSPPELGTAGSCDTVCYAAPRGRQMLLFSRFAVWRHTENESMLDGFKWDFRVDDGWRLFQACGLEGNTSGARTQAIRPMLGKARYALC